MASASTSYGFGKECSPFDVFISVGSDVKKGLAAHLYQRLTGLGLRVFLDIEELQASDNLTPQIEGAIKTASARIAIFSPRYAESSCCLDELVEMLESGKTILPVFYKVNPSDLKWTEGRDGVYARSLRALEMETTFDSKPRYDSHTLEKWREALSSAADISGLELRAYDSDEALLPEAVVKQVLRKVGKTLKVAKYPTGLDDKGEEFERTVLSQQQSEKTIVAGIAGIGGFGKTTLAKELFNRHISFNQPYPPSGFERLSHAFNQPYPPSGFERLVEKFLNACDGLPLSLKMLQDDIRGQLKISYDSLDEEEQQLFLDIACFFVGEDRDITAIRISDGSRWQGSLGLRNLEIKSLVDVDSENWIRMHYQVRDLVRDIAKKVTPHRLWRSDDILPDNLSALPQLRALQYLTLPDVAGNWTIPERIDLGGCSSLRGLPESAGNLASLQRIDLGLCSPLRGLPDLGGNWTSLQRIDLGGNWTSLQRIDLGGCSSLEELPESAGNWTSLKRIDLGGCSSLRRLPETAGNWTSLQRIDLGGCSALQRLPDSAGNWTNLKYSPLEEIEEIRTLPRASSASAASNYVYDVFINCHGPDVKRTFANHLYHRLVGYGLRPFIHEERHEADNIATQIKEAIATASVHVAIFSLPYAESRRCLDELLLMSDSGAPVIPVFYNVKRFDLHWKLDKDGVALHGISVPEISEFELEAFKYDEAELLDAVVKSVLEKVRKAPFYEVKYLKGLDQKVEDFENTVLLHRQNRKPQVVGIVGVAGVGKTTLAKELINRKSSSFNRACFLFDVARSSLPFLQSKLLKDLTNMNFQIENVPQGIELFTKHFSSIHGTAFVILDNVDDVQQLEALLPVKEILPSKSLILITSRSKDVLIRSRVEQSLIYNLTDLPLDKHTSCLDRKVKDLTDKILLQRQSKKPQVLGIVGISGIGKTRLAMEFFNRKSSDYTRSYFFHDVNETARTSSILHNLQSKLLQGLLQLDLQVQEVDESIDLFKEHVSYFRSLVILDNVDHWDQLHALLSVLTVLPSGSLILVTCREVEVLKRSGVQESSIYQLNDLNTEDSLELFCTQAFGEPSPRQEFEDLVAAFVRACNGLPLTLKVVGALLCGKITISYWEEQLHKLQQIPSHQIQEKLELCYDELNEEEQKIFLHIACSCVGAKRDFAVRVWETSGSRGLPVFESLQKRCFVDVDSEDCLIMHEYLRELGRTIADKKGLRRPPRRRRENDSDLLRRYL